MTRRMVGWLKSEPYKTYKAFKFPDHLVFLICLVWLKITNG